jgi:hypothetical protein
VRPRLLCLPASPLLLPCVLQFVLLLSVAFLLPLRLAFEFTPSPGLSFWDWFVDMSLMLDVAANFFVAYYDKKGVLVERYPLIARNYMKGMTYMCSGARCTCGTALVGCPARVSTHRGAQLSTSF